MNDEHLWKQAKNYRPICAVPVLYKLFQSCFIADCSLLWRSSSQESRPGSGKHAQPSTTFIHLCRSKRNDGVADCVVYMLPGLQRAFDSVEHSAIWEALAKQGVHGSYSEVLRRLYASQSGWVAEATETSTPFVLGRGTKQGDLLSALLFNAVLEDVFRDLHVKWKHRKFGLDISIGSECHLTALCFADDVVLMASGEQELKEMMRDVIHGAPGFVSAR